MTAKRHKAPNSPSASEGAALGQHQPPLLWLQLYFWLRKEGESCSQGLSLGWGSVRSSSTPRGVTRAGKGMRISTHSKVDNVEAEPSSLSFHDLWCVLQQTPEGIPDPIHPQLSVGCPHSSSYPAAALPSSFGLRSQEISLPRWKNT